MSSEVFENREEDFQSLRDALKKKLEEQLPRCSGEERKRLLRGLERELEEGSILIQEMEEEIKIAPASYKNQMLGRLRKYKRDMEQLNRDLRRAGSNAQGEGGFGFNRGDEFESMASAQRSRLLAGTESVNRTTDSIARSHMISAETEQIGEEIIGELGTQRESLVRTRDRLVETDAELSKSRKIIKTMARRVMTNKLILIFIIFLEVAILGAVVYWKFFS